MRNLLCFQEKQARDAGRFLHVCKDAEKVVYYPKRGSRRPIGGCERRMGTKRSKTTIAALVSSGSSDK
jgi:hypothetical protein